MKHSRIKTLAVTGGTGFVGQHLLEIARGAGYDLRALTRGWKPPEDEICWIDGALDRPESLARLADGADAVIHIAGLISGSKEAFEAVNVGGTAAMIDAARKAGVRRFIHISSLAAREPELSAYGRSKERSERLVKASGLDWTIIRPPAVYGPGDKETLELFKMAQRGFVALPPPGRFSVIHVRDLARLVLAALREEATVGELYEPDDGNADGWDNREFAQLLGKVLGRKARTLSLPSAVLRGGATLDRLFRRDGAKLTPDRVSYFCHSDWVAREELRPSARLWKPEVETAEGLRDTGAWYRQQGWLR